MKYRIGRTGSEPRLEFSGEIPRSVESGSFAMAGKRSDTQS